MRVWNMLMLCQLSNIITVCLSQYREGSGEDVEVTPELYVQCLETSALVNITANVNDVVKVILEYGDSVDRKATIDVTFNNKDSGNGEEVSGEEGSGEYLIVSNEFELNMPHCEYCLPDSRRQSIIKKEVKHLFPNTIYQFCLLTENREQLMCKNCSTQETIPIKHPTISTMEAGYTFIKIGWVGLTKEEQGGPHLTYRIFYWETDTPADVYEEMVSSTSHIISHLCPGTGYSLEVTSENIFGPSDAEKETHKTSTQKLSPPFMIHVEYKLRKDILTAIVTWNNDQNLNKMSDLTRRGSIIYLWKGEEGNYTLLESFNFTHLQQDLELNLTDIRNQHTMFTMISYYGMHHSNASKHQPLFFPPALVPTKHPTISTMEVEYTFIKIGWVGLTKEEQGGPHLMYRIFYWEIDKPVDTHEEVVPGRSHIISNLRPGTEYSLEVTSENIFGPSKAEKEIHRTSTWKLSPPSMINLEHEWKEDTLTAIVTWNNDQNLNNTSDPTRRGSIIHLWKGEEGNYTLLESFNFTHLQQEVELNLTYIRSQDTLLSMTSYYGIHNSNASIHQPLFYDVIAETKANLMNLVILLVGLVLVVILCISCMCCCIRKPCREGKYRTGEADKHNANITNTNFPVFANLQDLDKQAIIVGKPIAENNSIVHTSSISLPMDNDEMAFLYMGMDEDGSFIGDASFAIESDGEVLAMWREMDAGEGELS